MAYRIQVGQIDRGCPNNSGQTAFISVVSHVLFLLSLTGLIVAFSVPRAYGHDIPQKVTIRAFIKPEDQRLRMLVRVPLEAMRDVRFPLIGPGYLDLSRADKFLDEAAELWIGREVKIYENDKRLTTPELIATKVSLPTDRSFQNYDTALSRTLEQRLPIDTQIYWQQAMLDVLFEYRITSDRSNLSIVPGLETLGMQVITALHFLPVEGSERFYQYSGNPGRIVLDPRWHQAALQFLKLGFTHVLDGMDHLLFLLCLVLPFQSLYVIIVLITAFTVAHSTTLIAATLGLAPDALWFVPLVETVIAVSIVYMALENILAPSLRRRWVTVFGFGLVHGFGFAYALREMLPFGGDHLVTSLLAFNVGVEIGQLLVIIIFVPIIRILFEYIPGKRTGTILVSVLAGHTAWHWFVERSNALIEYDVWSTTMDGVLFGVMILLVLMLIIAMGAGWLLTRPGRPLE